MRLTLQILVLLAVTALALVLIQQHRSSVDREGWACLADARDQGMTVASLDTARDRSIGSHAEPWIAFELSLKLYEQASPADLERALQIAKDSSAKFGNHPVSKSLARLQSAIGSFLPQGSGTPASGG